MEEAQQDLNAAKLDALVHEYMQAEELVEVPLPQYLPPPHPPPEEFHPRPSHVPLFAARA